MVFRLHLDTETVGHIDMPLPLCVESHVSVRTVLEEMKRQGRGCVLVCQEGKLTGIFTERDALHRIASGASLDLPILEAMTSEPASIRATETVKTAIARMSEGGYRRLPVIDDQGRPLGLLKVTAILHYLVQHFPRFVYNLPPQPHPRPKYREGA